MILAAMESLPPMAQTRLLNDPRCPAAAIIDHGSDAGSGRGAAGWAARRVTVGAHRSTFARAATSPDGDARAYCGENAHSPMMLDRLAAENHLRMDVPVGVASNPKTCAATRERLRHDDDPEIRAGVARNPATPTELLEWFAEDDDIVRQRVAENPNTPTPLLGHLADDDDPDVRYCLACNPRAPTELLDRLARDTDPAVRKQAAAHPNTATAALDRMTQDTDVSVAATAQRSHIGRCSPEGGASPTLAPSQPEAHTSDATPGRGRPAPP